MVLVITPDGAGGDVECENRRGIEVVARPLIAHPRPAIAGAPIGDVGRGIVIAHDPHRAAARLPLVAFGPGFAARLAGRRHGICFPQRLPGPGVEGRDEAANPEFATRTADHDLTVGDQRRQCHVVAVGVVLDLGLPRLLAGLRVERHQHGVRRREIDFVAKETDPAARRMEQQHVVWDRPFVAPQKGAVFGVNRQHLISGCRDKHDSAVEDRRRLMAFDLAGLQCPGHLQPPDIGRRDLHQRAVAPAVIGPAIHQPIALRRLRQPLRSHGLVILQDGRNRRWRFRLRQRRQRLLRHSGPRQQQSQRDGGE